MLFVALVLLNPALVCIGCDFLSGQRRDGFGADINF